MENNLSLATYLEEKGDCDKAMRIYNEMISADSKNPTYYFRRGLLNKRLKNYEHALNDLRIANILNPTDTDIIIETYKIKIDGLLVNQDIIGANELLNDLAPSKFPDCSVRIKEELYELTEKVKKMKEQLMPPPDCNQIHAYVDGILSYSKASKHTKEEITKLISHIKPEAKGGIFYYECPISLDLMKDPVITSDGLSYEKSFLAEHISRNGAFDPTTRNPIDTNLIYPNYTLKKAVETYIQKQ